MRRLIIACLVLVSCSPDYVVMVESNTSWRMTAGKALLIDCEPQYTGCGDCEVDISGDNCTGRRSACVSLADSGRVTVVLIRREHGVFGGDVVLDVGSISVLDSVVCVSGR